MFLALWGILASKEASYNSGSGKQARMSVADKMSTEPLHC
jgi:hypothetical protein